eukprot:2564896-Alexandrium_andersonii.AAC.1
MLGFAGKCSGSCRFRTAERAVWPVGQAGTATSQEGPASVELFWRMTGAGHRAASLLRGALPDNVP